MKYLFKETSETFTPCTQINISEMYRLFGMIINSIVHFPSMDNFFGRTAFSFLTLNMDVHYLNTVTPLIANIDFQQVQLRIWCVRSSGIIASQEHSLEWIKHVWKQSILSPPSKACHSIPTNLKDGQWNSSPLMMLISASLLSTQRYNTLWSLVPCSIWYLTQKRSITSLQKPFL